MPPASGTVSTTLTAGVGRTGVRLIRLGRADRLELGTLTVRNVPVAIRAPGIGGAGALAGAKPVADRAGVLGECRLRAQASRARADADR